MGKCEISEGYLWHNGLATSDAVINKQMTALYTKTGGYDPYEREVDAPVWGNIWYPKTDYQYQKLPMVYYISGYGKFSAWCYVSEYNPNSISYTWTDRLDVLIYLLWDSNMISTTHMLGIWIYQEIPWAIDEDLSQIVHGIGTKEAYLFMDDGKLPSDADSNQYGQRYFLNYLRSQGRKPSDYAQPGMWHWYNTYTDDNIAEFELRSSYLEVPSNNIYFSMTCKCDDGEGSCGNWASSTSDARYLGPKLGAEIVYPDFADGIDGYGLKNMYPDYIDAGWLLKQVKFKTKWTDKLDIPQYGLEHRVWVGGI